MTKIVFNTKISEIENKKTVTSSLVTTTVLYKKTNEGENKTPGNSKYINVLQLNKFTAENFAARVNQDNLMNNMILIIN